MAIECHFEPAANALASLHNCKAYLSLRHCTKLRVLPKMALCVLLTPAANTLVSLHICAGKVTGQCNKYQYLLRWQRRLWGVCIFAQARLSLRHSTKISCAGSNGDLCIAYVDSECCEKSAPATTAHCTYVQPSVRCINASKMLPVRCIKIPQ